MQIVTLYLVTAVIFLGLDALMLRTVMAPLFERHIGEMMAEDLRMGAAAVFYLAYVAGLLVLVSLPALQEGAPVQALWRGALLGALAYGTYEFTSFAIMRGWSPVMVASDVIWGTVLTGVSAAAGVMVTRSLFG